MAGEAVEMLVSHHPQAGEMDAYERLLGDATEETRLCSPARITWKRRRIVDPALKTDTPVYVYEPGSWGPDEVAQHVLPAGGWHTRPQTRKRMGEAGSRSTAFGGNASYRGIDHKPPFLPLPTIHYFLGRVYASESRPITVGFG